MRGILIIISLFLTMASTQAHTIITTKDLSDKQPVEVFDCREKVYIYIVWDSLSAAEHEIEAYWFNPQGKQQEFTSYKFNAPVKDTWLWLELSGGGGSKFFKAINHRIGYENFIGRWEVRIYLDADYLKTINFSISC
jgi:hypothetical protein